VRWLRRQTLRPRLRVWHLGNVYAADFSWLRASIQIRYVRRQRIAAPKTAGYSTSSPERLAKWVDDGIDNTSERGGPA